MQEQRERYENCRCTSRDVNVVFHCLSMRLTEAHPILTRAYYTVPSEAQAWLSVAFTL